MDMQKKAALQDLLLRLGDDELIIGHRHSEWTGIGPVLEEDIAFASLAQDEIGHAEAYCLILHEELGLPDPDTLGFKRPAAEFRCAYLVEYPIKDYAFSLVRHFLYDLAEQVRLKHLTRSSYKPLAELASRLLREEKYHLLHATTWIKELGNSTEDAQLRLQNALNEAFPMAFSLFETTPYSSILETEGIQPLEETLLDEWLDQVHYWISQTPLTLPESPDFTPYLGGRQGKHSPYLEPLLEEMTEVVRLDPEAQW
jgi:ring-1,2-phenylacetyl-CoA epoxidase subunit PaaC